MSFFGDRIFWCNVCDNSPQRETTELRADSVLRHRRVQLCDSYENGIWPSTLNKPHKTPPTMLGYINQKMRTITSHHIPEYHKSITKVCTVPKYGIYMYIYMCVCVLEYVV